MHLSSSPYVPHVQPISLSSIWSPGKYLVSTKHHKTHYPISPAFCYFCSGQISSLAPYTRKQSLHSSLTLRYQVERPWEKEKRAEVALYSCIFSSLCF
jgi:hypothetical protein